MADYHIIDRRENPKGKNLPNRQKFLKRVRKHLNTQVREAMGKKKITDSDGTDIIVPSHGIDEPSFDYDRNTGEWDKILPGNEDFIVGDRVKKPSSSSGGGSGNGGNNGDGDDNFKFTITRDEYLDIVFEDLELPDLVKTSEKAAIAWHNVRSGFKTDGNPSQLDLVRSLKNSLGRRLALRKPVENKIDDLESKLNEISDDQLINFQEELEALKKKRLSIPWVDPIDLRYRRCDKKPIPNSQAVIFCLMDVSASMGEKEKDIAKRFFLLLYLFLQRKYQRVDIRFVRHTTHANECTEHEFFYDKESGGTIVSTGVKKVNEIIIDEYPLDAWNIYTVQASDGDNFSSDDAILRQELDLLIPKCQYYVYNEVKDGAESQFMGFNSINTTNVFDTMKKVSEKYGNLSIVNIGSVEEVVPMFRHIFSKKTKNGN